MPWVETTSPHFAARHELVDDDDVAGVLELLEGTRERLADAFATIPGEVEVVVHGSDAALAAAQPYLPVLRRMVAPAARRYLVGWFGAGSIHVLAPRVLDRPRVERRGLAGDEPPRARRRCTPSSSSA